MNSKYYYPLLSFLIKEVGIDPNDWSTYDQRPLNYVTDVTLLPQIIELGFKLRVGDVHFVEYLFSTGVTLQEVVETGADINAIRGPRNETIYHMWVKHATSFTFEKEYIAKYQEPDQDGVTPFMILYKK